MANLDNTYIDSLKKDFRKFVFVVWKHIGLPEATPLQYDICRYLQTGPNKVCIQAFRGVGKSFLTSAYALWLLLNDPQVKILVISASKSRADAFTTFSLRLIHEMQELKHLSPREDQRQSRIEFDVGPAVADQSPSVRSLGITGQLTGSRADIIIADDVEVLNNAATADMREKLIMRIKEFSAIIKPLPSAKTIFLGTPQTEDSIYSKLPDTFQTRIWPAQIPTDDEREYFGPSLAPYIANMAGMAGEATDPARFSSTELATRQSEYGKAGYALQFMLITHLSDEERYPLKIRDLVVMDTQGDRAPMILEWLPDIKREIKGLPNLAMAGDRFYAPASNSDEFAEYTGSVMAIDPAGRGKDETGYAIVKYLNGYLYVTACGGLPGGYDDPTLGKLADLAKAHNVNYVVIEANFGDGMYTELFKPVLSRKHKCTVEEVKHSIQKERRIIDTIEPVMNRHKLIFDRTVVEDDYRTAQGYDGEAKFTKSLIYQMTRLSYDRGSLKHDDRLDALSIAVDYWSESMAKDADGGLRDMREEALLKDLQAFTELAGKQWKASKHSSQLIWNPVRTTGANGRKQRARMR